MNIALPASFRLYLRISIYPCDSHMLGDLSSLTRLSQFSGLKLLKSQADCRFVDRQICKCCTLKQRNGTRGANRATAGLGVRRTGAIKEEVFDTPNVRVRDLDAYRG